MSLMRQDPTERQFLECLWEVRLGHCSETSRRFLDYLSRSLEDEVSVQATHIYFRKLSVLFDNSEVLSSIPGEFVRIEAANDSNTQGIQRPAEKVVILKLGCKVMFLWNVSENSVSILSKNLAVESGTECY